MLYGLVGRLSSADPQLVQLVTACGADQDIYIAQVDRTVVEEEADIAKGVAWLADPMDSKHVTDPTHRPLARAVDLAPWVSGRVPWQEIPRFQSLGAAVKATAATLEIAIAWGGDWVHHQDWDHFELVGQHGGAA